MDIRVYFTVESLFGDYDPEGYDLEACGDAFEEMVYAALVNEFPDAENVEIVQWQDGNTSVDGREDHPDVPWVEKVVSNVWQPFNWLRLA